MDTFISLGEGLSVTIVSMLSVFVILVIIMMLISVLRLIGNEEVEEKPLKTNKNTKDNKISVVDDELIAVISATIAYYYQGKTPNNYRIKSIEKIS